MTNKFTCVHDVLNQLATLAQVPDNSRLKFRRLFLGVFREAKFNADTDRQPLHLRANNIIDHLKTVKTAARALEKTLARLQRAHAFAGPNFERSMAAVGLAESFLQQALTGPTDIEADLLKIGNYERPDPIGEYRASLTRLIGATIEAEQQANMLTEWPSPPRSVGESLTFFSLVKRMDWIAKETGGHWTNYQHGTEWAGTFIRALNILRPYLPNMVWPVATLGRVIKHLLGNI